MKAESADYLAKAHATLAGAEQIAALPLPHVAAREAYYAAYHAAEAYIFEQTGKAATTHRGVRSEFGSSVSTGELCTRCRKLRTEWRLCRCLPGVR
jgi:uncharacterized protein (UPF0332 family)